MKRRKLKDSSDHGRPGTVHDLRILRKSGAVSRKICLGIPNMAGLPSTFLTMFTKILDFLPWEKNTVVGKPLSTDIKEQEWERKMSRLVIVECGLEL